MVRELASCAFVDERVAVLIAGRCGTGKSHIAQAIGHAAVRRGVDVMFSLSGDKQPETRATTNVRLALPPRGVRA